MGLFAAGEKLGGCTAIGPSREYIALWVAAGIAAAVLDPIPAASPRSAHPPWPRGRHRRPSDRRSSPTAATALLGAVVAVHGPAEYGLLWQSMTVAK